MEELTITKSEYGNLIKHFYLLDMLLDGLGQNAELGWDKKSITVDSDAYNVLLKALFPGWHSDVLTRLKKEDERKRKEEEAVKAKEKKDGDAE